MSFTAFFNRYSSVGNADHLDFAMEAQLFLCNKAYQHEDHSLKYKISNNCPDRSWAASSLQICCLAT